MTPIKHDQETDLPWAEILPLLLFRVQYSQTPQGTSESMDTLASAVLKKPWLTLHKTLPNPQPSLSS